MNIRPSLSTNSRNFSSGEHEQDIWRDKYFSTLDELENEQAKATAAIDVLRRGLLSVSLAGDGLDADLDDKLLKLRGELKTAQDYSSLSKLLQNIESDLIRLETQKLENTETQKNHTGEALSLLLKSPLDAEIKQELKIFQKKIRTSENNSDLARQFESDLIKLLLPLLTELSKDFVDKHPPGGLWNRFRKSVSSATQPSDSESTTAHNLGASDTKVPTRTSTKANNQTVSESIQSGSNTPLFAESKDFASKLITSIYDNSALTQIARALSNEISAADAAALLGSYPKILNLLDLSQTQNKKGFLDYLSEISYSLTKVSQSISTTQATQRKINSQGKEKNQQLRGGIDKIRIILDTSTDLENLKTQTQKQLDDIIESLDKSSAMDDQTEQKLTDLAAKQSTDLASALVKTKSISEAYDLSPSSSADPELNPLTKLKNTAALAKELTAKLSIHKKRQQRLCLCIGDVRSLHSINDGYGRNAGDKALELLAKEIQVKSKDSDFLAYTDNGRFVLLKPVTELNAARPEIDALDIELAKLPFRFKGSEVKVKLTFAIEQSSLNDTASSLIERTELALNKAKLPSDAAMPTETVPTETKPA
jgi:diguanylate cyclase (GGDEF)-like protein